MKNFDRIKTEMEPGKVYELCITLDSVDAQRLGIFLPYFQDAGATLCIDHHVTNKGFAGKNHVVPSASSCSEGALYLCWKTAKSAGIPQNAYTRESFTIQVCSNTAIRPKERWRLPETWWTKA